MTYLETSFLVSLYAIDVNSARAADYIQKAVGPFPLTAFGEAELTNAVELRVFRREITTAQATGTLAELARHIQAGTFFRAPLPASVYDLAQRLSRKHTPILGTRTLDILHIASALDLEAGEFYTFDKRQAELARTAGLKTPVRIR